MKRVRVIKVLLEVPPAAMRPKVRVEEEEDVLPLDRLVEKLDHLAKPAHARPDGVRDDGTRLAIEFGADAERIELEGRSEEPAEDALHDLVALELAKAERILRTQVRGEA